jgi:hypothetical protein
VHESQSSQFSTQSTRLELRVTVVFTFSEYRTSSVDDTGDDDGRDENDVRRTMARARVWVYSSNRRRDATKQRDEDDKREKR